MLVYYAHCKAIYNSPQERRDENTLILLGFDILNPNDAEYKPGWEEKGMEFAEELVGICDALAFRALPGGAIPSGVSKEIAIADKLNLPIFELPNFSFREAMSVEHTRQYLKDIGER